MGQKSVVFNALSQAPANTPEKGGAIFQYSHLSSVIAKYGCSTAKLEAAVSIG